MLMAPPAAPAFPAPPGPLIEAEPPAPPAPPVETMSPSKIRLPVTVTVMVPPVAPATPWAPGPPAPPVPPLDDRAPQAPMPDPVQHATGFPGATQLALLPSAMLKSPPTLTARFFPAVAGLPLAPSQLMPPVALIAKLPGILTVVGLAAQTNTVERAQFPKPSSTPPMSV